MVNDKSKKKRHSDNPLMKKSAVSGSCKPCMPVERNGANKNKSASTKNLPMNDILNVNSCYKKCASPTVQEDSSSTSNNTTKSTVEPSGQTTTGGSCYAKCGPPSVQQTSSLTSNGSTSTTCKPDHVETVHTQQVDSTKGSCEFKPLSVTNPFIEKMDEDILYHIALGNKSHDLVKMFGDVKFVVMGSTPKRMEQFAYFMANQLNYELPPGTILNDISRNSHRYAMYKVGPILSVSHGMGTPSIGILLHELIKLMSHAGVKDPVFTRIGTCGGFNKKAGTVVVSNKVVNDFMEPFYELTILGKKVRFPANLDQAVVNEILSSLELGDKFETIAGVTYCTDNFYEGSGRADGAICEFSLEEGLNYYKELQKKGVVNVEMESLAFAALTCRAGIKSAVVTVILSDRLETDQIKQSKEALDELQTRPQRVLANYIKKKLLFNDLSGSTHDSTSISTAKIPISSSTTGATTCTSCGGTGSSIGKRPAESTSSVIPTMSTRRYSNTISDTTNNADISKSTTTSLDPVTSKSCGGFGKDLQSYTGGTNATESTTTAAPIPCKLCEGTGTITHSSNSTSTLKRTGTTSSTTLTDVGKSTDSSTTQKSAEFTSTTTSDSTICKTCKGIGKDKTVDVTIPSLRFGSTCGTSPSIVKPTSAPCKSCLGSGKTNESNTTTQSKLSMTRSSEMMQCKCCGGAGVVPNTKTSDDTITTLKPYFATNSQSNPAACIPCLKLSGKEDRTVTTSTTTPQMGTSSSIKSANENSSNANICKPCSAGGSMSLPSFRESTTSVPSVSETGTTNVSTTASGLATSAPNAGGSNVCKPCSSISPTNVSEKTTLAPFQKSSTGTSSESTTKGPADVCKPRAESTTFGTTGTTTTFKPTSTDTTSQSSFSSAKDVCKPSDTIGESTIGAPGTTTNIPQSGFSTSDPCQQNAGSNTSSANTNDTTTVKPGNGSTTTGSHSSFSCDKLFKENGGQTSCGTSTCRPGSDPPTSRSGYSNEGVDKPSGGSTTSGTKGFTTNTTPSDTRTTAQSGFSIEELCKRSSGGTSTCKPGNNPPTSRNGSYNGGASKPPSSETSTSGPRDFTSNTPGVTTTASSSTPFGVCKPCSGGRMVETSTTPATSLCKSTSRTELATNGNRTTTVTANEISKSTYKPSTTTSQPTANLSTSTANLDPVCSSNGTSITTAEPKRSKCVPYTCHTADKTDTTPLPTTSKAYLTKDTDNSSNSTISNDSWSSCYQKCSSEGPSSEGRTLSSNKPLSFETPEQDNMKGVPPAVGPCCSSKDAVEFREVPETKGTACALCEEKNDSNEESVKTKSSEDERLLMGQIKTESSAERRPSKDQVNDESTMKRQPFMSEVKTESQMDRRPSMGQIKAKSLLEKRPSFDSTTTPSGLGRCGGGRSNGVGSNPNNSETQSTGGLCSGNIDDSPDEPCASRKKIQVKDNGRTYPKLTGSLREESKDENLDETHDGTKNPQSNSDSKTDEQSAPSVPYVGNIQGCPITIRGPCIYAKDDGKGQSEGSLTSKPNADLRCTSTSTPKPSPDTPDTSTIRTMPDFVTPTPPSAKGIICYSKFTNSNGVLVTSSVNKEANKYDESPSPCAACKKYQENKTSNKSTPASSQPEIVKCPHKLKRLKDECQGYD